jgi:transposase
MVVGKVGDVRRFPTQHHFAAYTGTAPREYSSRGVAKHRLSGAGNRKFNHTLHIIALSHKRYDQRVGEYYARKLASGKGKKGALRCLKRRLSDVAFRTLVDDRSAGQAAGRKGNRGRLQRPARLTEPR